MDVEKVKWTFQVRNEQLMNIIKEEHLCVNYTQKNTHTHTQKLIRTCG